MNCDNCGEFIGLGKPRVDLLVPGEGNRCYHPECYEALFCEKYKAWQPPKRVSQSYSGKGDPGGKQKAVDK